MSMDNGSSYRQGQQLQPPQGMHLTEVSMASSVAEHDLSDFVPPASARSPYPPLYGPAHDPGDSYSAPPMSARYSTDSNGTAVEYPAREHVYSPPASMPMQPGRVYSASHALEYQQQRHSTSNSRYPHHPRSMRSPTFSVHDEHRPGTGTTAPTALQSFPRWDPTWRSGGVSEDGRAYTTRVTPHMQHSPHPMHTPSSSHSDMGPDDREAPYLGGWVPESIEGGDEQERGEHGEPLEGRYQYGVGYEGDEAGGKALSKERRAERLKLLEREFGRVAAREDERSPGGQNTMSSSAKLSEKQGSQPEKKEGKDSFRAQREREKADEKAVEQALGVDRAGRLQVGGARKRKACRWMQVVLSCTGAVAGIGGAFLIKLDGISDDGTPAPQGAISTYALYVLSALTFLITCRTHLLRPCIRRGDSIHKTLRSAGTGMGTMGGFSIPVFSNGQGYGQLALSGGKKAKKGIFGGGKKKQRKGMQGRAQPPMTVNLVVDPRMLASLTGNNRGRKSGESVRPARYDDSGYDDEDELEGETRKNGQEQDDGEATLAEHNGGKDHDNDDTDFAIPCTRRRQPGPLDNLSAHSSLALQETWKSARSATRRRAWWDALLALLWTAESVVAIGFTGACAPGSFGGWCDAYNADLACAVCLAVAFWTSVVFGILDLRRSRSVPRIARGY